MTNKTTTTTKRDDCGHVWTLCPWFCDGKAKGAK